MNEAEAIWIPVDIFWKYIDLSYEVGRAAGVLEGKGVDANPLAKTFGDFIDAIHGVGRESVEK